MNVPWPYERCVRCCRAELLTKEHLIPAAIGGRFTSCFLCKPCNDCLGQIESSLKSDPGIRLALEKLKEQIPERYMALSQGQTFTGRSDRGSVPVKLDGDSFQVSAQKMSDQSYLRAAEDALLAIRTTLTRQGESEKTIAEALERYAAAPEDEFVELPLGLKAVKGSVTNIRPTIDATVDPRAILKIAYEFLALHRGSSIFHDMFQPIRDALYAQNAMPNGCAVEPISAARFEPLHGIVIEPEASYTLIQIRLFGCFGFRVQLSKYQPLRYPDSVHA